MLRSTPSQPNQLAAKLRQHFTRDRAPQMTRVRLSLVANYDGERQQQRQEKRLRDLQD
jgi:hypothetical protein